MSKIAQWKEALWQGVYCTYFLLIRKKGEHECD
ncbi:MAG: hypothetical protein H6Q72_4246 [Firmicutes bacterium]|nr:hypothetical protein [Bacillota bacterium]